MKTGPSVLAETLREEARYSEGWQWDWAVRSLSESGEGLLLSIVVLPRNDVEGVELLQRFSDDRDDLVEILLGDDEGRSKTDAA